MLVPSQVLWFLCLASPLLIQPCFSIKCWVCNSETDPNCGDPFKNETLPISDCNFERLITYPDVRASMCRKVTQKVNGKLTTIRSCGFLGEVGVNGSEKVCTGVSNKAKNIFIQHCSCNSKDGCNGSDNISASSVILGMSLFIVTISNIFTH